MLRNINTHTVTHSLKHHTHRHTHRHSVGVFPVNTHTSCNISFLLLSLCLLLAGLFLPFSLRLYNPSLLQRHTSDIYYLRRQKDLPTTSDEVERRGAVKLDFGRCYLFLRRMDVQGHRQQGKQGLTRRRDE